MFVHMTATHLSDLSDDLSDKVFFKQTMVLNLELLVVLSTTTCEQAKPSPPPSPPPEDVYSLQKKKY